MEIRRVFSWPQGRRVEIRSRKAARHARLAQDIQTRQTHALSEPTDRQASPMHPTTQHTASNSAYLGKQAWTGLSDEKRLAHQLLLAALHTGMKDLAWPGLATGELKKKNFF